MSESTFGMLFLAVGAVLAGLGILAVVRRRMTMVANSHHRRVNENRVLRDGPAVLAGSAVAVSGLWLVRRSLPGVMSGGEGVASFSITGPLILLIAGLLAGFAWQRGRDAQRVLANADVRAKISSKLRQATEAAREQRGPGSSASGSSDEI